MGHLPSSDFGAEDFQKMCNEENALKMASSANNFALAHILMRNQEGQVPTPPAYDEEDLDLMDDDFLCDPEGDYLSHDDNSSVDIHMESQAVHEVATFHDQQQQQQYVSSNDGCSFSASLQERLQELQMQRESLIFQRFEESMRQTDRSREMLRRLLQGEQEEDNLEQQYNLPQERQNLYNWVQEQQPQQMFSS